MKYCEKMGLIYHLQSQRYLLAEEKQQLRQMYYDLLADPEAELAQILDIVERRNAANHKYNTVLQRLVKLEVRY